METLREAGIAAAREIAAKLGDRGRTKLTIFNEGGGEVLNPAHFGAQLEVIGAANIEEIIQALRFNGLIANLLRRTLGQG